MAAADNDNDTKALLAALEKFAGTQPPEIATIIKRIRLSIEALARNPKAHPAQRGAMKKVLAKDFAELDAAVAAKREEH